MSLANKYPCVLVLPLYLLDDGHCCYCCKYYTLLLSVPVVAFLVAYHQNKQLIGPNGLLPADQFLREVKKSTGGRLSWSTFSRVPSLLWLFDYNNNLPALLDRIALLGMGLAGFLVIYGAANWFIMLSLWMLYHSLVNVGQRW